MFLASEGLLCDQSSNGSTAKVATMTDITDELSRRRGPARCSSARSRLVGVPDQLLMARCRLDALEKPTNSAILSTLRRDNRKWCDAISIRTSCTNWRKEVFSAASLRAKVRGVTAKFSATSSNVAGVLKLACRYQRTLSS